MAIYSDERRPTLANLIKFSLLVNVVLFIILVLFWVLRAGIKAALIYTGTYATILIGLNAASFLFYEQLFRPEDDPLRRIAEILGSLQVLCSMCPSSSSSGPLPSPSPRGLAGSYRLPPHRSR